MSRRRVRRLPLCPSLRVAGRRAQPARRRRARARSSRLSAEPKGAAPRLPAPMKGRSKGSVNSISRLTQKIERNRHRISPRPQFFDRGGAHRRSAAPLQREGEAAANAAVSLFLPAGHCTQVPVCSRNHYFLRRTAAAPSSETAAIATAAPTPAKSLAPVAGLLEPALMVKVVVAVAPVK